MFFFAFHRRFYAAVNHRFQRVAESARCKVCARKAQICAARRPRVSDVSPFSPLIMPPIHFRFHFRLSFRYAFFFVDIFLRFRRCLIFAFAIFFFIIFMIAFTLLFSRHFAITPFSFSLPPLFARLAFIAAIYFAPFQRLMLSSAIFRFHFISFSRFRHYDAFTPFHFFRRFRQRHFAAAAFFAFIFAFACRRYFSSADDDAPFSPLSLFRHTPFFISLLIRHFHALYYA